MAYFEISGYWKDDQSEFDGYIISEYDSYSDDDEFDDDDIFFFGLSENEIIEAINLGEDTVHEFVITSYCPA